MKNIPRLVRTARYLRWSQLLWRGRYAMERRFARRELCAGHAGSVAEGRCRQDALDFPAVPVFHQSGSSPAEVVELLSQGKLHRLNRSFELGRETPDWRLGPRSMDRLGTITLHYHDWVYSLAEAIRSGDERASALLEHYLCDWIRSCPCGAPGTLELAWNSFAIATRLSWWIRSYLAVGSEWLLRRPAFTALWLKSMHEQASYLHEHLEWDLRGNHLLRDAVGLAWAGRFLEGDEPRRWQRTAARLAVSQADEQVLADGGHFERSPMYHVHVMEDVLSLALLAEDGAVSRRLQSVWEKMAQYSAWMRHPDGELPLFNDAALHAVCEPDEMLQLGQSVGVVVDPSPRIGGRHFAETGMIVWHDAAWSVFFDVGQIGPDYQPGHAHADTLSIEASFHGRRVFVDPGTYDYDDGPCRRHDRRRAATTRSALTTRTQARSGPSFESAEEHAPLTSRRRSALIHLKHRPAIRDTIIFPGRRVTIVRSPLTARVVSQSLTGSQAANSISSLADCSWRPGWRVREIAGGWVVSNREQTLRISVVCEFPVQLSAFPAAYHPEYGREETTMRLSWHHEGTVPFDLKIVAEPCD